MTDKEKLIKLLDAVQNSGIMQGHHVMHIAHISNETVADHLIANGVTVGKLLTQFLHLEDQYSGLKAKYLVFKGDTGEKLENCFVLRPEKDPAAIEALRAYARTTENQTLAEDICDWVGRGEPVQQKKPMERFCYYCLATIRAKKIGHEAMWTGRTPKWCPLGRDLEAEAR